MRWAYTSMTKTTNSQPALAHEALDRTADNVYDLSIHLLPDLVCAVDLPVGMPDALGLGNQLLVTLGSGAIKFGIAHSGSMQPVTRRGDLQNLAHRLDPKGVAVAVNESDQELSRRSGSA